MSLQTISKSILQQAEDEKKELDIKLSEEENRLEKEMFERVEKQKKLHTEKHNKELKSAKEKIIGNYKKDAKNIIMSAKKEIIDEVYNNALNEILNLPKKETQEILKSLLNEAKKYIDYEIVYVSSQNEKFVKGEVAKPVQVKVLDNIHGLIFETKNKRLRLDMSFETLLRELFEENKEKFLETLFSSK